MIWSQKSLSRPTVPSVARFRETEQAIKTVAWVPAKGLSVALCDFMAGSFRIAVLFTALSVTGLEAQTRDSTNRGSSPALQALLAEASAVNSQIPGQLRAYRAHVETEMSLVLLDSGARERTAQLEQIESDVRFRNPNRYDQRVVGYRSQSVGPTFSLLSIFGGWTTPTLYGNRLQLGVTPAMSARIAREKVARDTTSLTIHPLSTLRDSYYAFEGGDTAVVLYSRGRSIPVVRVRVTPSAKAKGDAILFFGDMYLDADRRQIVRMRGRLVELRNGRQTLSAGSRIPGVGGASFVEVENV